MPLVTPPAISPLPTPPSSSDPANFDARADAFLSALPGLQAEANALAQNLHANATFATGQMASDLLAAGQARTAAAQAAAQAAQHAASAGAASNARSWASGQAWRVNDVVWGVSTPGVLYRCIVAHAGSSTPPERDAAHWASIGARIAADPLAGPASVTFERDAQGRLIKTVALVDGKTQTDTFERDPRGLIVKTVTAWDGKTRTETYARDAASGSITQMTAEVA